ncbi:hypothetical protein [Ideonella sp. B508-1]|uniref:hypothetical protein n=1 Tax=Ideonella sp. B508-1 TaxID=137716 RepID=UPI0003482AC2|nr:hypothetical protein [Ideonella sp. B508-1]
MSRPNKVYLLMHASGQSFKIGIAVQTHRRASALPDDIDMAKSLEAVVTTGRAESVEKILHYLCRDLSTKAERIERGEVGDGYTEWFAAEAFDQARAFIDGHAAMLGVSPLRPVQVPEKDEQPAACKRVGPAKPSKAEKAEAARKRLAEYTEAAERQNLRVLSALSALLTELKSGGVLMGLHVEGQSTRLPSVDLYLRGPTAKKIGERLTWPSEDLTMVRVGGGGMRLFSGMHASGKLDFVRVGIPSVFVLNESESSRAPMPFIGEARQLLRSLIPAPGGESEAALRAAHSAMHEAWEQFQQDIQDHTN